MANVDGAAQPRPTMLVRGSITDRPWGATLAAIGLSGLSGQLTLHTADHQVFRIAFAHGGVIGATSPQSVDSVPRVALASRMISADHARLWRKTDDVDRLAALTRLDPQQVNDLKRRVIIQRAARTFTIDAGDYVVEDRITIPVLLGIEVDIRAAIYHGMRVNLSQQRLTRTRHKVGSRFVLRAEAIQDLPNYGFGADEQAVLQALRAGTSGPEVEALHRDLDPRMIEAVICTLAVCDAVTDTQTAAQDMSLSRTPTPREPTTTRVDAFFDGQRTTRRPPPLSFDEVEQLIAVGIDLLDRGVDHFTFLGLPRGAPVADVREAYLELARYLRPERLLELGIDDEDHAARSVFARVVIAFTVLTDPARRADYLRDLAADPV